MGAWQVHVEVTDCDLAPRCGRGHGKTLFEDMSNSALLEAVAGLHILPVNCSMALAIDRVHVVDQVGVALVVLHNNLESALFQRCK